MALRQDLVRKRAGAKPVPAVPTPAEHPSPSPPVLRRLARLREDEILAAEQDELDAKTEVMGVVSPRSEPEKEAEEDEKAEALAEQSQGQTEEWPWPELPESSSRVDEASRF